MKCFTQFICSNEIYSFAVLMSIQTYEKSLYCYEWFEREDPIDGSTVICGWGLDIDKTPHLITLTGFLYSVYLELPLYIEKMRHRWNGEDADLVAEGLGRRLDDNRFVKHKSGMYKTLYRGDKEYPMLRLEFNRKSDAHKLDMFLKKPIFVHGLGELNLKLWGLKIGIIREFLTNRKLKHVQWFKVNCRKVLGVDKISTLDHEYIADYEKITPISQIDTRSWLVMPNVFTLDIETYSDNHKAMPIRTMDAHVVYMVSCIFQRINDISSRKRYLIIMGDCKDLNTIVAQKQQEECQELSSKLVEEFNRNHDMTKISEMIKDKGNPDLIIEKLKENKPITYNDFNQNYDKSIKLIRVKNEHELCEALTDLIHKYNPEILSGYNILGFDYPYLNARLTRLVKDWNPKASKLIDQKPKLITPQKWTSKAYGHTDNSFLDFPGRISIDMLPIIRRGHKLPKYDLDTVGNAFLKRGKHDIKAAQMFKYYEDSMKSNLNYEKCIKEWIELKGSIAENEESILSLLRERSLPEVHKNTFIENDKYYLPIYCENVNNDLLKTVVENYEKAKDNMAKVALYCVEDSELVVDLIDKTGIWIGLTELANTVGVSIVDTYSRGQQIRGLNLIYDLLEPLGVVVDYMPPDLNSKFVGGFVADPEPGIDEFVITEDFTSLYPSIIMAYNICMNTYIRPGEEVGLVKGVDYEEIPCPIFDDNDVQTGFNIHRFWKKEKREGYIPRLVSKLITERKAVKVEMSKCKEGTLEWMVLNERQLALKVCANSIYGMLGVREGALLPFIQGAEAVTAVGREKIQGCNKYLIDKYNARIVYNDTDSVMFTIPGITNYPDAIEIGKRIEKELTATMPKPMGLEMEKVGKMLRFKKKKYTYWPVDMDKEKFDKKLEKKVSNPKYGEYKSKDQIITRGIVLARRDNCKLQRDIYRECMEKIMNARPFKDTLSYMMKQCILLLRGEFDFTDLTVIRSIGSGYKSETYFLKIFAEQLKVAGLGCSPGDRISYLVCEGDSLLGYRLKSDEMYINNLQAGQPDKIDYRYYLENLFIKSFEQLWSVGYRKELNELEKQYEHTDRLAVISDIFYESKKDKGEGIKQVWNQFNGDVNKIIPWLEDVNNHKYLHNKYIKARQKLISGRNVFKARITKTPVKMLLKAVDMGNDKLEEYAKVVLSKEDYNELFPLKNKE